MNLTEVAGKQKKFRSLFRSGDMRIINIPPYSSTVVDIETHLDNLQYYDNYQADVIVVDYADLLAPENNKFDYRHQLDAIWKSLRKVAQERNIVIVTATQSNRKGLKGDIDAEDIAEDVRKLAHVSKMLVINQNKKEYRDGVMRVKQIKERDGRRNDEEVTVLQCLDIGRVYLDSRLKRLVVSDYGNGKDE